MFIYREYEIYRSGAVNKETYLSWTLALHEHFSKGRGEYYLSESGSETYVTPQETLNGFLKRAGRYYPGFVKFIGALQLVPYPKTDAEVLSWQKKIGRVVEQIRKYRT